MKSGTALRPFYLTQTSSSEKLPVSCGGTAVQSDVLTPSCDVALCCLVGSHTRAQSPAVDALSRDEGESAHGATTPCCVALVLTRGGSAVEPHGGNCAETAMSSDCGVRAARREGRPSYCVPW